ncbi:hypothetical protein GCM10009107_49040 [Ideonella azotifigens]|uniref:Uncharacterized protein n=1 Tax=Ideonella azotifigens TaxID=513160 RepID=A0ABN1KDP3_9BURK
MNEVRPHFRLTNILTPETGILLRTDEFAPFRKRAYDCAASGKSILCRIVTNAHKQRNTSIFTKNIDGIDNLNMKASEVDIIQYHTIQRRFLMNIIYGVDKLSHLPIHWNVDMPEIRKSSMPLIVFPAIFSTINSYKATNCCHGRIGLILDSPQVNTAGCAIPILRLL